MVTDISALAANSAAHSLKRTRILYDVNPQAVFLPSDDPSIMALSIARRRRRVQPSFQRGHEKSSTALALVTDSGTGVATVDTNKMSSTALIRTEDTTAGLASNESKPGGILVVSVQQPVSKPFYPLACYLLLTDIINYYFFLPPPTHKIQKSNTGSNSKVKIPTPTWHAPWKLSTVLSSHLGWVRSIAMDPTNDMFATGSADRTIKLWDLAKASVGASDALKLTLTGHISPIRGLAFSPRHPYLFSAGEDKMVKCWDLETNQVIRHYHGHLSGVFCLALHPTLDVLVTGGRDAVARVWDMRTRTQIHVLGGHEHTVASLLTKSTDPQIITGSHDTTIKLWDLVAGKCMTTLTHHQKSIRAMAQPSFENTFVSGAADCLKYWQGKDGRFLKSYTGHKAVINAMAVNDDGVLMSGGDDGSMHFWDYKTGYNFQSTTSIVQPGSLDAENAIFAAQFDGTGTRLITGEADKTIKIWKQDDEASEMSHPIDMVNWRKKCLKEAKQRY